MERDCVQSGQPEEVNDAWDVSRFWCLPVFQEVGRKEMFKFYQQVCGLKYMKI